MDLLEYAKELVNRGHTSYNAQVVHLQELVQEKQPEKIKSVENKQANDNQIPANNSNHTYLLITGLTLFGLAVLAISYWLGKKKNKSDLD